MKDKLWKIISNPPVIKVQGISVNAWQIPSMEDREAMVDAIVEIIPITIKISKKERKDLLDWIKASYNENRPSNLRKKKGGTK